MKEFHKMFAKAENKEQLSQLLEDAFTEINFENRRVIDTVFVFNDYYNLDFTLMELARLGRFIGSGDYKKQMELYV